MVMAAAKKKQEDKHLKILRELVALPFNKECFDCHQRGPTYVNMTVGSFVCTSCSGLLRGLAPPHRVKSISMASFTADEIEMIKSRGNEFCQKVWLGLFNNSASSSGTDLKDDQKIKDFMVDKYDKKRYYVDPSMISRVQFPVSCSTTSTLSNHDITNAYHQLNSNHFSHNDIMSLSAAAGQKTFSSNLEESSPSALSKSQFTAQSNPSRISNFSQPLGTSNPISSNSNLSSSGVASVAALPPDDPFSPRRSKSQPSENSFSMEQASFADFDNNPVFNAEVPVMNAPTALSSSISVPLFPSTFGKSSQEVQGQQQQQPWPPQQQLHDQSVPGLKSATFPSNSAQRAAEDRYAALKDLDDMMKTGNNNTTANGNSSSSSSIGNDDTTRSAAISKQVDHHFKTNSTQSMFPSSDASSFPGLSSKSHSQAAAAPFGSSHSNSNWASFGGTTSANNNRATGSAWSSGAVASDGNNFVSSFGFGNSSSFNPFVANANANPVPGTGVSASSSSQSSSQINGNLFQQQTRLRQRQNQNQVVVGNERPNGEVLFPSSDLNNFSAASAAVWGDHHNRHLSSFDTSTTSMSNSNSSSFSAPPPPLMMMHTSQSVNFPISKVGSGWDNKPVGIGQQNPFSMSMPMQARNQAHTQLTGQTTTTAFSFANSTSNPFL